MEIRIGVIRIGISLIKKRKGEELAVIWQINPRLALLEWVEIFRDDVFHVDNARSRVQKLACQGSL